MLFCVCYYCLFALLSVFVARAARRRSGGKRSSARRVCFRRGECSMLWLVDVFFSFDVYLSVLVGVGARGGSFIKRLIY